MKRNFKGIWIPAGIWLNKELTTMEKLFFIEIDSLDHPETGCFAMNGHFSSLFLLSKSRCSEIITSLELKKFITKELIYEGRKVVKRILRVDPIRKTEHLFGKQYDPLRKTESPPSEKAKDNNTIDNNTYIQNACAKSLKEYSKEIGNYFGLSSDNQLIKVFGFLNIMPMADFEIFVKQFPYYKKFKKESKQQIHSFFSFCGEWKDQDWQLKFNNLKGSEQTEPVEPYRKKIS